MYDTLRQRMIREHLLARDIHDKRVLEAMAEVPRHLFIPE
ncbi:MAG: protein-L-isoaspartate O-methyltransferase, partial [Chloroflexota bacterium]